MITTRSELMEFLEADSINFKSQTSGILNRWKANLCSNPISEQKHIWKYIKEMRYVEYYDYKKKYNKVFLIPYLFHLIKLRKESHITGFQIPPHTCGKGLTIWHWGAIIVNPGAKLGSNCTLYPGVLIGHKAAGEMNAVIGDNVFIGSGTKIIGAVKIGNNVTIGQNCIIVKDIPNNTTIVSDNKMRFL